MARRPRRGIIAVEDVMRRRRRERLDGDVLVFGRRGVRKPSSSASAPRNNREILRRLPLVRFRARFVQLLARRKGWRARGSRDERANASADDREDDSDDEEYAPASEDEADDDDASTTSSDASTTSSDASTTSSDASASSASDSDSSDIQILGERPATSSSASSRVRPSADPVAVAARALTLRVQSERGYGNCMFCAFSSGVNAWIRARGSIGPAAAAAGLIPRALTGGHARDIIWADLRAVLVRRLRDIVRDAPEAEAASASTTTEKTTKKMRRRLERRAREAAMTQLMSGSQGRDWLTRGALARASVSERFDAHLDVMSRDAKPHSGTSRWTRFWGTDVEAVALASALRVAVVCVETADGAGASGRSPLFLGVPADVAEVVGSNPARERRRDRGGDGDGNRRRSSPGPARFGRYMPRGEASDGALTWTAARGRVRLTVREVKANSAAAAAAIGSFTTARDNLAESSRRGEDSRDARLLPALVIIHRPGHFDSLQPREGRVLVLEREAVRGGER